MQNFADTRVQRAYKTIIGPTIKPEFREQLRKKIINKTNYMLACLRARSFNNLCFTLLKRLGVIGYGDTRGGITVLSAPS